MHLPKLATLLAILAAATFAGSAHAQISGTIGGDVVDPKPLPPLIDVQATTTRYLTRVVVAIEKLGDGWITELLAPGRDSW
jgi:hypothetical protein